MLGLALLLACHDAQAVVITLESISVYDLIIAEDGEVDEEPIPEAWEYSYPEIEEGPEEEFLQPY